MKHSFYDNELTADLLNRCDGPVHLDIITCRVSDAIRNGNYTPEEIAAASVEALNILKANNGYIPSNEFQP